MSLMRNVLLWGSQNQRLRELLPRYEFVRRAVTRFMPGEEIEDALNAAVALKQDGIPSIVTHLGENLTQVREANGVAEHYLEVLARIKRRGIDCHISVKLTQLGLDLNEELCYRHLSNITSRAKELDNFLWIDMESSTYVDKTLDMYKRLRSEYPNVGVCLQSYLFRTASDFETLLPLAPSIRLVKGTYAEPKDVAYGAKKEVDENFLRLAKRLAYVARTNDSQVGIATHDSSLIERVSQATMDDGGSKESFEIQMLYGIRREAQQQFRKKGFRVRVLISYGSFWFPWYMRRLAERPANVLFVLKNIFAR